MRACVLLAGLLLRFCVSAFADAYVVSPDGSGDFPTIQAAIDASLGAVHPFPLAPRRRVHDGDFVPLDDGDAIRTLRKEAVDFPAQGKRVELSAQHSVKNSACRSAPG